MGTTMHAALSGGALYSSTLTRKGQITVPVEIRRRLGLERGDKVVFVEEGDVVLLKPAQSIAERTAGILAQYRKDPPPTPQEERAAFEQAVAEDVVKRTDG